MLYIQDPLKKEDIHDFEAVGNIRLAKFGCFLCGSLILLAGCIGEKFAATKNRTTGYIYLGILTFALAIHIVLIMLLFGTAQNLQVLDAATAERRPNTTVGQPASSRWEVWQRRVMGRTFESFATRFASSSYDCRFVDAQPPGGAGQLWRGPGGGEPTALARSLAEGADGCAARERRVACSGRKKVGAFMTSHCRAQDRQDAGHFEATCEGCASSFYSFWDLAGMDTAGTLLRRFQGPEGTAFCRCLSHFLGAGSRYARFAAISGVAICCIEALLVVAVCTLLYHSFKLEAAARRIGRHTTYEMEMPMRPHLPSGEEGTQTLVVVQSADGRLIKVKADGQTVEIESPSGPAG